MKSSVKSVARFLLIIAVINLHWKFTECNSGTKKYGYIFTAPWVFDSDSSETVCLTLKGLVDAHGRITVKLSNTNGIVAQTTKYIRYGCSECFDLKVPATAEKEAFLHIDGQFDGQNYPFRDRRLIKIRHAPDIVLVQTDKDIYKAGQKVQFRVLQVTTTFLPSTKNLRSIWIEDPLNVKVYEEKSPVAIKGIISSSFQLSDKPEAGNWTIFVEDQTKNRINKIFRVNKYVLPHFEIQINIPPEIRPDFDFFIWEVCAKYTYGEAVKGQIRANITRMSSQLSNVQNQPAPPMYLKHHQIEGCLLMRVHRNDLGFHRNNFINYNLLNFYVEVTEHGTGIMLNNYQQKEVKVNPYKLYILSKRYFKPRLSYYFKLLVKDVNDEPVKGDSFSLQVSVINLRGVEKQRYRRLPMKTDGEGLAKLDIKAVGDSTQTLIFKITPTKNPEQTYEYFGFRHSSTKPIKMDKSITERLRKWKSPSDSYIKIEGPPQWQSLKCNQPSKFTVHCTGVNDDAVKSNHLTIYFQIMAKNNILRQGSVSLRKNQQIKDETSSFRTDIPLTIEPNMSPKVEVVVYYIRDDGEVVSDSEAFLVDECFANPVGMRFNSSKALPGVNVNLELRASPNSLCSVFMTDKSTILLSRREFNPHKIFRMVNDRPPNIPGPSVDRQCTRIDPQLGIYERDKSMLGSQAAFDTIGLLTMTDLFLELNPCQPVSKPGGQGGRKSFSGSEDDISSGDMAQNNNFIWADQGIDIRSSFPETWLWELVNIGDSGQTIKTFPMPHTITNWTGNTFCVSPETGLRVSPRTSIISDQPVFLTLDLPYSVRKGETVPVAVSVHNHLLGCFPVLISLTTNQDFVLKSSSNTKHMCVCGKQTNSHIFQIQPMRVGIVSLSATVSALSPQKSTVCSNHAQVLTVHAQDTIIKSIIVLHAGTPKEAMKSYWICGNGERKTFNYPLKMPSDGIEGTAKASVRIAGDLIAPTLGGLDHLVKLPSGCGEQNMVKFAPLVFVTSYLKSTNQSTNALKATATAHMKSGYLNQLKWAHSDGAFSIWGKGQGNLRLTAYVIKTFVKARSMADVYIDPKFIRNGQKWIISQQLSSGCFTRKGEIALGDSYEKTLELAVMIALLESGVNPTDSVIDRAFRCIDKDAKPSNLRLAMKAYATALARKTSTAQQLLSTLQSRSIKKGNTEHWTNGPGSSHAINIETTSYVLLAIATLREGHATMAMNILRWLIGQRTSVGGFSSTKDTVVAIQAIETFASQLSKLSTNMQVTLTNDKMGSVVVNVNQWNRLAEQTKPISMSDTLHVATTGHGCALLEIIIKYDIPAQHTSTAFHLDVTILPYNLPTNQHKKIIHICTRYQGHSHRTNMVLIEIEMVTGYQADNDPLQKMQNADGNLGKFENRQNKLVLYYNELKKDLLCFNVVVTRMLKTGNVKPAIVRVYDYSVPELSTTKQYTLL